MSQDRQIIIDRIESTWINRASKILMFCGIGSLIVVIIKLYLRSENKSFGVGFLIDVLILSAISIYFILQTQKQLNKRKSQFIEWKEDSISYNLKEETETHNIFLEEILLIDIDLNKISIIDNKNQKYVLDISDFYNYKDRLRIKENFNTLADRLKVINI
jgi:hypothetical protein